MKPKICTHCSLPVPNYLACFLRLQHTPTLTLELLEGRGFRLPRLCRPRLRLEERRKYSWKMSSPTSCILSPVLFRPIYRQQQCKLRLPVSTISKTLSFCCHNYFSFLHLSVIFQQWRQLILTSCSVSTANEYPCCEWISTCVVIITSPLCTFQLLIVFLQSTSWRLLQ